MDKEKRTFFFVTLITALIVGGLAGTIAAVYVTTSVGLPPEFVATVFGRAPKVNQPQTPETKQGALPPQSEDELVTSLVKKVQPAVVSISISKNIRSFSNRTGPNVFPFDDFFRS